jgi:hypothetical protein
MSPSTLPTRRTPRVVLQPVQRTGVNALRDALTLSPHLRDQLVLTGRSVTFLVPDAAAALDLLDQLRGPLAVARGKTGHPYASTHALRRRLEALLVRTAR